VNVDAIEEAANNFFDVEQIDARRIFHGRGQLYPGLEHICIDWFSPLVLISAYEEIEDPAAVLQALQAADTHGQIQAVMLQNRYIQGAPAQALYGELLEQLIVTEDRLRFEVHPGLQQNSGLFMDTRSFRDWLLANSQDRNVLNLFAYTCSLSVAALAGGAESVTNVDMSKTSIKWGEKNHEINMQDLRRVNSIPHNLFKSWGKIKQFGRYDIVIIDPPMRQRGSFDASKNYGAVIKKMKSLCKPNAQIIATINSPFLSSDYLQELFEKHLPQAKYLGEIAVAPEYRDKYPERALNICHFEMAAHQDLP